MGKMNLLWKNKKHIFEGIKNNIFKKEHIEVIAAERMAICKKCPAIDLIGDNCLVAGLQPCCKFCGCTLAFKTRDLSSSCGNEEAPLWKAILTDEENEEMKTKLNITD